MSRWAPLALALACASPQGRYETVSEASTDWVGPGVVAFDLTDVRHRRDWYGRGDPRVWLPLDGVEAPVVLSEKHRCAPSGLAIAQRARRVVHLRRPKHPGLETPLRLRGDCRWFGGRAATGEGGWGRTLVFRGGPGRVLRGRSEGGSLRIGDRRVEVRGPFEIPLDATPGLRSAHLEGGGRLELAWAPPALPEPTTVRDAIVVVIDTLRADRLAPFDPTTRVHTPRMDGFAEQADVYTKAYATASWTKPSVASVLTALYPWQHRALVHDAPLRADVPTLAEVARDWGLETVAFSGNGYVSPRFGFDRGFDDFRSVGQLGRGRLQDEVDDLLAWLDARPAPDRRYLAYLHATDPHSPYLPRADHLREFDPAPYEGPIDFSDPLLLRRIERDELPLGPRDRERLTALYDAEVRGIDAGFGALLDGLRRRGRLDHTLIVFVADHGEELFDHGSVGHGGGRLHQELIRVPLAVYWPGVSTGRRVEAPVSQIDVAPTVLEALGLPSDLGSPSARSLRVALSNPPERFVAFGQRDDRRGVTDGHWVLVRDRDGATVLYDLDADPQERRNLARDEPLARRYLLDALAREMARNPTWREQRAVDVGDQLQAQLRALGYVGDE